MDQLGESDLGQQRCLSKRAEISNKKNRRELPDCLHGEGKCYANGIEIDHRRSSIQPCQIQSSKTTLSRFLRPTKLTTNGHLNLSFISSDFVFVISTRKDSVMSRPYGVTTNPATGSRFFLQCRSLFLCRWFEFKNTVEFF